MKITIILCLALSTGCISSRKGENETTDESPLRVSSAPSLSSSSAVVECRTFVESSRHIYILFRNNGNEALGYIHSTNPIDPLNENRYPVEWKTSSSTWDVKINGQQKSWNLKINRKKLDAKLLGLDENGKSVSLQRFNCFELS